MTKWHKIGMCIVAMLAATQVAWGEQAPESEMNLYASKLKPQTIVDRETRQVNLSFGINTDVKGVWVYLYKNNDAQETIYADATKTGTRAATAINLENVSIPADWPGGKYGWAVKVVVDKDKITTAAENNAPSVAREYANVTNRYKFQYPKALAINTYPESEYCGYSFVGEAGGLSGITTKPSNDREYRTGSSKGVYVFGPSLGVYWSSMAQVLGSTPYGAFTGGVDWKLAAENGYYGPYRMSTDKDGYVYMCQNYKTYTNSNDPTGTEIHERIWRVHAEHLTKTDRNNNIQFTCILTTDKLYAQTVSFKNSSGNNATTNLPKRVLSMSVGQEGDDKVLYVISGYTTKQLFNDDQVFLSSWKITETGNGNCDLTFRRSLYLKNIPYTTSGGNSLPQSLKSQDCSVVPGNHDGDVWLFQKASSANKSDRSFFSALHLSPSGNDTWAANYRISSDSGDGNGTSNTCGTGAISKHPTKDGTAYYLAMPSQTEAGYDVMKVWNITDTQNGTNISREMKYAIMKPGNISQGFGTNSNVTDDYATALDAVAFDIANNLYFTSSKQQLLFVYALPKEDYHLTPASKAAVLDVPFKVAWNSSVAGYTIEAGTYNTAKSSLYPYLYSTDELPTLSKKGYVFQGWYSDKEFTERITSIEKDIELYAKWTELIIDEETDNASVLSLVNSQSVSMKVSRELPKGELSTMCLPFAVNETILADATYADGNGSPLANADIYTFYDVSEANNVKTLHFAKVAKADEVVAANTPFLILPQNDVTQPIFFHKITVNKPANLNAAGQSNNINGVTFYGVINPTEIAKKSVIVVANNRLAVTTEEGTLMGLRGYFTAAEGTEFLLNMSNTPTLLQNIYPHPTAYKLLQDGKIYILRDGAVYSITGKRIQ